MGKGVLVTATGTDIGKTYVTALIIKKLCEAGYKAGYYKAALSGAETIGNELVPGDADYVKTIAKLSCDCAEMVSYVYKTAVSPHLAAKLEGNPVKLEKIINDYKMQCAKYDYIVVEGSGGIICPIRYDEEAEIFLEDIIKALGLDVIIVADAGLGTINSTLLTVKYLKSKNIAIKGIMLNRYHVGIMEDDNVKMIEKLSDIPVIALVAEGASDVNIDADTLKRIFEKDEK